jgi:hypothetical protein
VIHVAAGNFVFVEQNFINIKLIVKYTVCILFYHTLRKTSFNQKHINARDKLLSKPCQISRPFILLWKKYLNFDSYFFTPLFNLISNNSVSIFMHLSKLKKRMFAGLSTVLEVAGT